MTPGLGQFRSQGHEWKDLYWVPLIIASHKILELLTSWFQRRRFFYIYFPIHGMPIGDDDPRDVANLDPRGMIGRIYVDYHLTLLHTKYTSFRPCGFREEDF